MKVDERGKARKAERDIERRKRERMSDINEEREKLKSAWDEAGCLPNGLPSNKLTHTHTPNYETNAFSEANIIQ